MDEHNMEAPTNRTSADGMPLVRTDMETGAGQRAIADTMVVIDGDSSTAANVNQGSTARRYHVWGDLSRVVNIWSILMLGHGLFKLAKGMTWSNEKTLKWMNGEHYALALLSAGLYTAGIVLLMVSIPAQVLLVRKCCRSAFIVRNAEKLSAVIRLVIITGLTMVLAALAGYEELNI